MDTTTSKISHISPINRVIALHCSGGTPRQWNGLAACLNYRYWLHTPRHIGSEPNTVWSGERPFTLADEAARTVELIDNSSATFHLVGHSYGGAVALHAALARPHRVASIALYEPCAFHLLKQSNAVTVSEYQEIQELSAYTSEHIAKGDNAAAMCRFVDYWNGPGAWQSLKPENQIALQRWAPTANYEFEALINENLDTLAYSQLNIPVKLLQGSRSPAPVKAVCAALASLLPQCESETLADMGHMGPITHADRVAELMAAHVHDHASVHASYAQAA